jgi:hypothetical protein
MLRSTEVHLVFFDLHFLMYTFTHYVFYQKRALCIYENNLTLGTQRPFAISILIFTQKQTNTGEPTAPRAENLGFKYRRNLLKGHC